MKKIKTYIIALIFTLTFLAVVYLMIKANDIGRYTISGNMDTSDTGQVKTFFNVLKDLTSNFWGILIK